MPALKEKHILFSWLHQQKAYRTQCFQITASDSDYFWSLHEILVKGKTEKKISDFLKYTNYACVYVKKMNFWIFDVL